MAVTESVELRGHIIDSGMLSRLLDDVLDLGSDYVIERFDVGKRPDDDSYARVVVTAPDEATLSSLVMRLQSHGANLVDPGEARAAHRGPRRRLPRRLLLDDQPGDRGAPRRSLGATSSTPRWTAAWWSPARPARARADRAGQRRRERATGSSAGRAG